MNTVSPEAFYAFQQALTFTCLGATALLVAILFFIKVAPYAWDSIRKIVSENGIKVIVLIPSIIAICFYGMTKGGYSGHITYDSGIKSGTTVNLVSNDTISIYWQRDTSQGMWVPDSAAVYIDFRLIGDNSAEWGLLAQSTVGAGHWEGTYENATNYDYNVWAYYIPPEPVHTNGVWIYKTLKDRMRANALPLRARVEINGKAIATPREVRRDLDKGISKVAAYLYEADFDDTYPEFAEQFYHDHYDVIGGGCTSARKDNDFARNYDWLYDDTAEFVVRVTSNETRYASLGVASLGTNMTEQMMMQYANRDILKALPGMVLDGINSEGVFASVNVIAHKADKGYSGTDVCGLGAVRYILDNYNSALAAATYIASHVYIPEKVKLAGYSFHWLVGDPNKTYIVEDGTYKESSSSIYNIGLITNFRVFPSIPYVSPDRYTINRYDPYGSGLERYGNLIFKIKTFNYEEGSLFEFMKLNRFTIAYNRKTNPHFPWPTEFTASSGKSLAWPDDDLRAWAEEHVPENRVRGDGTWQTVHTSYYNISERFLKIMIQEQDDVYNFPFYKENNQ